MLDRLVPVRSERAWWSAELPVEVDGGGEGEDPRGDAADKPAWGLGEVPFETELVLERVDDRLDALADAPDRRCRPLLFVSSTWPQEQPAELSDRLLEVGAREALVGDHELTDGRLALEQLEHRLALACVRRNEVEVADAAIGAAPEHESHAPVETRMGGAVAEPAPGGELGAVRRLHALPAGKRGRVDVAERVVEAGELVGDRPPERHRLGRCRPAALVVARLRGQGGEEVGEPALGGGEEPAVTRLSEQHLRHHQAEQFVVGDPLGAPPPRLRLGRRKERAGGAIDCDQEGVEVGAHVGLLVDGALTPPTFDTRICAPYPVLTASPVNYRSSI